MRADAERLQESGPATYFDGWPYAEGSKVRLSRTRCANAVAGSPPMLTTLSIFKMVESRMRPRTWRRSAMSATRGSGESVRWQVTLEPRGRRVVERSNLVSPYRRVHPPLEPGDAPRPVKGEGMRPQTSAGLRLRVVRTGARTPPRAECVTESRDLRNRGGLWRRMVTLANPPPQ